MSQAQTFNITTTAGAKTVDLIAPAAGFGGTAEYAIKEGPNSTTFQKILATVKKHARNGDPGATGHLRILIPSYHTDATTGLTTVGGVKEFNLYAITPDRYPENQKDHALEVMRAVVNSTEFADFLRDSAPKV